MSLFLVVEGHSKWHASLQTCNGNLRDPTPMPTPQEIAGLIKGL